jgi:hypothetical protein
MTLPMKSAAVYDRRALARFALGLLAALALFVPRASFASGFTLKTPSVDEKNGEWHIKVRIDLPRAPPMMHTPMRVTFSKEAVDERAIMAKGAEPVHHRMVLDVPAKQIVSMDVDFADASGRVFKSTYFDFDVKRADGFFEAGEYVVSLSGPDGDVGGTQRLTLKGDNPPVYRGAMDFSDNKQTQRGPKMEAVSSGLDAGPSGGGDDNAPAATQVSGAVAPVGSGGQMIPAEAFNKTAEEEGVKGHPQGCGCLVAGLPGFPPGAGSVLAVGIAAAFARRRRNRA